MRTVKDIMTREPQIIHVDLPLREAAERMKEAAIGALLVVDGDELVGVVTDRDLVIRGMAQALDPTATAVIGTMTRHVVYCRENSALGAASARLDAGYAARLCATAADSATTDRARTVGAAANAE